MSLPQSTIESSCYAHFDVYNISHGRDVLDGRTEMKSSKWLNSAKRRRIQAKFRRHLCRILKCPVDSCYTTGELLRDARALRGAA